MDRERRSGHTVLAVSIKPQQNYLLFEPLQLVALDPLARHSMKNVAICDKWCDMQVHSLYVNHRIFERTALSGRHPRDSMPH